MLIAGLRTICRQRFHNIIWNIKTSRHMRGFSMRVPYMKDLHAGQDPNAVTGSTVSSSWTFLRPLRGKSFLFSRLRTPAGSSTWQTTRSPIDIRFRAELLVEFIPCGFLRYLSCRRCIVVNRSHERILWSIVGVPLGTASELVNCRSCVTRQCQYYGRFSTRKPLETPQTISVVAFNRGGSTDDKFQFEESRASCPQLARFNHARVSSIVRGSGSTHARRSDRLSSIERGNVGVLLPGLTRYLLRRRRD